MYPSRFHSPGRRQRIAEFSREASLLSTSLIAADENLAGHPHRRLIEGAISFWRAGAARHSDKVCFGCRNAFGIGRAAPGAFLVAIRATNASDAAIGGLCTACFYAKTGGELDQVAAEDVEAHHRSAWPMARSASITAGATTMNI